jgi:hypothetical protein
MIELLQREKVDVVVGCDLNREQMVSWSYCRPESPRLISARWLLMPPVVKVVQCFMEPERMAFMGMPLRIWERNTTML